MWGVRLEGDESDLNDLSRLLSNAPTVRVMKIRHQWCLSGPEIDSSPDATTALRRARERFPLVLAGALLSDGRPRVANVEAVVIDGEGTTRVFLVEAAAMSLSTGHAIATVTDPNGDPRPVKRTRTHCEVMLDLPVREVGEVAVLLAGERSPVDLYKVFEIIKHQMGCDFVARGWVAKPEQSRFTSSLNHPAALGSDARHARLGATPPKNPMTLEEAQAFVEERVREWVSALATQYGVPLTDP